MSKRDRRDILEHSQEQQFKQQQRRQQEAITESLEAASHALTKRANKYFAYTTKLLVEDIVPPLRSVTTRQLQDYGRPLADDDDWHWSHLEYVLENTNEIQRQFLEDPDGETCADLRRHVRHALSTAVAIAEHEDVVMSDYANRVDVIGIAENLKIGEHLQKADMDFGNPVRLTSQASGALKTLFCGGTGQGKSAGVETEAESFYRANFEEGTDYKLIDLVGLRDGENWFYDVPQNDDALRSARAKMGLPECFTESDDLEDPSVEILAPLTPELADRELPYDTEDEEFVVRPFTVPAVDIEKPLLVSMIAAKLTPQQESIIRSAYDDTDRHNDDWSLRDLATTIKQQEELSPSKVEPIVATLRQLQAQGFIRTRDDPHTLDLRRIFEDKDTITVFTQAFIDGMIGRLLAFGYLAYDIATTREQMHGVPECVLLMRELWKVAPHKQRQAFDTRAASLQEMIGQMLSDLFRENRHAGVHLLADTQQPSDLLKPVREMFNRYVVFSTNKDTAEDIYSWTSSDDWTSFYRTLNMQSGQASVVGMVEPAVTRSRIEFVGPVQYAPPSHHHRMERKDSTGWHARAKYLEGEELRKPAAMQPDWVENRTPAGELEIDEPNGRDEAADPELKPVHAFAERCLEVGTDDALVKDDLATAFNAFVEDETEREPWALDEHGVRVQFGQKLESALPDNFEMKSTKRDGRTAYQSMSLSPRGQQYLDEAFEGLEDSAAPLSRES